MPAKDLFHEAVRRGLEKDRWTITDDPLELEWEEVKVKAASTKAHLFFAAGDSLYSQRGYIALLGSVPRFDLNREECRARM